MRSFTWEKKNLPQDSYDVAGLMIYFAQAAIRKITKSCYPHSALRWEAHPGLAATRVRPELVTFPHTADAPQVCAD